MLDFVIAVLRGSKTYALLNSQGEIVHRAINLTPGGDEDFVFRIVEVEAPFVASFIYKVEEVQDLAGPNFVVVVIHVCHRNGVRECCRKFFEEFSKD
jgi:hypothetical protein